MHHPADLTMYMYTAHQLRCRTLIRIKLTSQH